MLERQFRKFVNVYGIELGGSHIYEGNASYLIRPEQEPNLGKVVLKAGRHGTYPQEYNFTELGISSFTEFEKQVDAYFAEHHEKVKKILSKE